MLASNPGWDVKLVLNAREPIPDLVRHKDFNQHLLMSNTVEAVAGADVLLDTSPFYRAGLSPYTISKSYLRRGYVAHDLIPFVFPDRYFPDELTEVRHRAKLERLRHADFILANSEHTKHDIESIVSFGPPVYDIGTGVPAEYRPARAKSQRVAFAQGELPSISGPFILYTGGSDWRKNLEGLIQAYAELPFSHVAKYQLVIVCEMNEGRQAELSELATSLGVQGRVVLTGKVPHDLLIALYQTCDLFVFPSHYEGFGLPVVEALRCGARVICGDNSNLPALVPDARSRFDTHSIKSISACLGEALNGNAGFTNTDRASYSWDAVAQKAWAAITACV